MDKQTFEQRFMKIVSTFGAKNYSQDRVTLIFTEVKFLSVSDLEKLINHMVGNQRMAPLVSDFRKAISEMGLRPERKLEVIETTATKVYPENYYYQIDGNIWADNAYIYIKGKTIRDCSFVVKADHPHHPLVKLDEQVREERITEIQNNLKNGTHSKKEESKINEMKRLNFENFFHSPRTPA